MAIDRSKLKQRMFRIGASQLHTLNEDQCKKIVVADYVKGEKIPRKCNCGGDNCPQNELEYDFKDRYSLFNELTDDFFNDLSLFEEDEFNPYIHYGNKLEPMICAAINKKFSTRGTEKNGVKYKNYVYSDYFAISHDWWSNEELTVEIEGEKLTFQSAEIKTVTQKLEKDGSVKPVDVSKYYYQTQAQAFFEGKQCELLVVYERPNIAHWSEKQINSLIEKFDPNLLKFYLVRVDQKHFNEFIEKRLNPFIERIIEFEKYGKMYKREEFNSFFPKINSQRKIKKSYIELEV